MQGTPLVSTTNQHITPKFLFKRQRLMDADGWLLHSFPSKGYFSIVFPSTVGKRVKKATFLADEVWVTNKDNNKVVRMMFVSACHKG
jgi:hypothetical protein